MTDILYSIDVAIFRFINDTISNPIFDKIFPFLTEVKHWHIAYIILWGILFFKGGRKGKIAAVGVILLIVISDQFSSHFLKNLVQRIRPCNALEAVRILVSCTDSYSFPSSHAVNNFAVAAYFYRLYPNYKIILFTSATLMALSRPYVGVHYPSDVIIGALIGTIIGYLMSMLIVRINEHLEKRKSL